MTDEPREKAVNKWILSHRIRHISPDGSWAKAFREGFDEGGRAERERADRLQQECDDIYERLSWILAACTIDRDAKNEIEALLK